MPGIGGIGMLPMGAIGIGGIGIPPGAKTGGEGVGSGMNA